MSSWPWAVFRIWLPEIIIYSREEAVRYNLLESTEPLTTGEHYKLKNSLKPLAFSLKSETCLLAFKIGGIKGTFLPS